MKQTTNDMAFDGMLNGNNGGYNSSLQHRLAGIPTPKTNYGRGPTRGNTNGQSVPNPTAKSGKINGGAKVECCTKCDSINVGRGPTGGGKL